MKRKRRHHSAEFKARIAQEAIKEEKTINAIAKDNDIAPAQVSQWKKELQERTIELFEGKNKAAKELEKKERREQHLERKIGQLLIEKEFLEKKCDQLGIDLSERP